VVREIEEIGEIGEIWPKTEGDGGQRAGSVEKFASYATGHDRPKERIHLQRDWAMVNRERETKNGSS